MTHHQHHPVKPHHRSHTYPEYVTNFIKTMVPIAQNVKKKWGTPVAVLVAQGALESSWGQHVKGNAYFGIKGHAPTGKSVVFGTHEVLGGKTTSIDDRFRAYGSMAEAAEDYGRLLRTDKRYSACFAYVDQPERFVEELAKAGYATDPQYAAKLKSIIRSHALQRYDQLVPAR